MKSYLGNDIYVETEPGYVILSEGGTVVKINTYQFFDKLHELDRRISYVFHNPPDKVHFSHGLCIRIYTDEETKNPLVEIRDENNKVITLTYTDWIELVKVLPSVRRDSTMSILKLIEDVFSM